MQAGPLFAKLADLAENGDAAAGDGKHLEEIERRSRGLGARVIGVVDYAGTARGTTELLTAAGNRQALERRLHRRGIDAQAFRKGGGEHGIGNGRLEYLKPFVGERMYKLYQSIKLAFDEKLILNPGKIIVFDEKE